MIPDVAYDELAAILIVEAERLEREPEPAPDEATAS
jgi:hypothetical protein